MNKRALADGVPWAGRLLPPSKLHTSSNVLTTGRRTHLVDRCHLARASLKPSASLSRASSGSVMHWRSAALQFALMMIALTLAVARNSASTSAIASLFIKLFHRSICHMGVILRVSRGCNHGLNIDQLTHPVFHDPVLCTYALIGVPQIHLVGKINKSGICPLLRRPIGDRWGGIRLHGYSAF